MALTSTMRDADIVPARITTAARNGTACTRDFGATQGEVEVAPGITKPLVAVDASVVTAAIATQPYFWAIRTSISIFHSPSKTFVTAQDALHDLPHIPENIRGFVHDDSFWSKRDALSKSSPSSYFQERTALLARQAAEIALLIDATNLSKEDTEKVLLATVRCGLNDLHRRIEASLATKIPL